MGKAGARLSLAWDLQQAAVDHASRIARSGSCVCCFTPV